MSMIQGGESGGRPAEFSVAVIYSFQKVWEEAGGDNPRLFKCFLTNYMKSNDSKTNVHYHDF